MKNILILLVMLFCSVGYSQQVAYTVTVDTTKAVNGYKAIDGKNFYIVGEEYGDLILSRVMVLETLNKRSIALDSVVFGYEALVDSLSSEITICDAQVKLCKKNSEAYKSNLKKADSLYEDCKLKNKQLRREVNLTSRKCTTKGVLSFLVGTLTGVVIKTAGLL